MKRADAGTRTPDLALTKGVLFRLSYDGVTVFVPGAGFEPAHRRGLSAPPLPLGYQGICCGAESRLTAGGTPSGQALVEQDANLYNLASAHSC